MPPTPSTLATVMFTAGGAVVPFVVLLVCFVLGLVRR